MVKHQEPAPAALRAYLTLLESGRPAPKPAAMLDTLLAARALVRYAWARGALECSSPWELAPKHVQELTQLEGGSPAGGWRALAALMGGTGLVHIAGDLEALVHPEELEHSWPDALLQRALIEAFTCVRSRPPERDDERALKATSSALERVYHCSSNTLCGRLDPSSWTT